MKILNNSDIIEQVEKLAIKISNDLGTTKLKLFGIPRGGISIVYLLMNFLPRSKVVDSVEECDLIVDDIIDSGKTMERYHSYNKPFYGLYDNQLVWLSFPWERTDKASPIEDNLIRIKQFLVGDIEDSEKEEVLSKLNDIIKDFAK